MIDINKLTIGEIAKIEEISQQSITKIADENAPKGRALLAMAFVVKKREDPNWTLNKTENLTFDEVNDILGLSTKEAESEESPNS